MKSQQGAGVGVSMCLARTAPPVDIMAVKRAIAAGAHLPLATVYAALSVVQPLQPVVMPTLPSLNGDPTQVQKAVVAAMAFTAKLAAMPEICQTFVVNMVSEVAKMPVTVTVEARLELVAPSSKVATFFAQTFPVEQL